MLDSGENDSSDISENDEEEEFADPLTVDLDAEEEDGDIDSDDALGPSDNEKFKDFAFRGSGKPRTPNVTKAAKRKAATDFMSDSDGEDHDQVEDEDLEVSEEDENMVDESGEELSRESGSDEGLESMDDGTDEVEEDDEESGDDDDESDEDVESNAKSIKSDLKALMSRDQKRVVGAISEALKTDAEKGAAVKQQRKTFDSLLNIRIRLQKALVATNTIPAIDENGDNDSQPYQAAEDAAVKLFNSLNAMRHQLDKASNIKTGSKRKREIDFDTTSSDIWQQLQTSEKATAPVRRATLEKWSEKVRSATATTTSRKLNTATPQSLTQVLADQLSSPAHLIKRTRTPRSCAPLQSARKLTEDASIYDDADFYQLLLKELVDQRMVDSSNSTAPVPSINGKPLAQWTAVKEAKTKKNVDTKASKGRKMRFTVHEKLQNFMAPEERGDWESDAVDRFFGALLGQRVDLGEDVRGAVDSEDEDGGVPLAEEALMLFRS